MKFSREKNHIIYIKVASIYFCLTKNEMLSTISIAHNTHFYKHICHYVIKLDLTIPIMVEVSDLIQNKIS